MAGLPSFLPHRNEQINILPYKSRDVLLVLQNLTRSGIVTANFLGSKQLHTESCP